MSEAKRTPATWYISLDCECPYCGYGMDLMEIDRFLEDEGIEVGEHNTQNSRGIAIACPECEGEFEVNLEY